MTTQIFEWQPDPDLLAQLTTLAHEQGRSPETIVTQAVTTYLETHRTPSTSNSIPPPLSLEQRRAFLKLSLAERRRLLELQADALMSHYQTDTEWRELQTGDLIEP